MIRRVGGRTVRHIGHDDSRDEVQTRLSIPRAHAWGCCIRKVGLWATGANTSVKPNTINKD